ncbi:MAG: hypothetical protein JSV50_13280, partial [Desulfobacteraceae bacterium]
QEGQAILEDSNRNILKFYVRPPFSEIHTPSDDEIREINKRYQSKDSTPTDEPLTDMEAEALSVIREHYRIYHEPILATELDKKLKLKRGRKRQTLLNQMLEKGLIEKVTVPGGRGNPLLRIIPLV